ncbi:MAG: tetratricopeptide repeat protein [Ignavibacteriae bacterium]|nr:tetratricopeptide repeat protein [Ignavibacteriota bacterium]
MKIKALHIYFSLIIVVILSIIFFSSSEKSNSKIENKPIVNKDKMPNDEVHQNINSLDSQTPTKENVNNDVVSKMNILEKEFNSGLTDTVKMLELANMLTAGHQIEKGIIYYNKILEIDSSREDVLLQLAFVHSNLGEFSKAIDVTEKMLKINPTNKIALYNMGALNATIGKKDLAKSFWQDIINKYPNSEFAEKAERSIKKL